MADDFRRELTTLVNKYSMEQKSDTPDFLLAGYIISSLAAYEAAVIARDRLSDIKSGRVTRVSTDLHEMDKSFPPGMVALLS